MRLRRLVIDTNIIMAAMIRDSAARDIIIKSNIQFFAPNFVFEEIGRHADIISRRNNLSVETNLRILKTLGEYITIVEEKYYASNINKARRVMGAIDEKDAPFIALALSFENDGIWTEDKDFEEQRLVKILKTRELVDSCRS